MDDKPKIEITTQEPGIFAKPIPTMMVDLELVFSHPLFTSYYSDGCKDLLPIRPNGTIDFELLKQYSVSYI